MKKIICMKKQVSLIIIAALALSLAACRSNTQPQPAQGIISQKQMNTETESGSATESGSETEATGEMPSNDCTQTAGSNILIAYFTVPETDGVDAVASASRVVTAEGVLGNTEIPFVTHGGSGFSHTIQTIEQLEPGATVVESGLSISGNSVADVQDDCKNSCRHRHDDCIASSDGISVDR